MVGATAGKNERNSTRIRPIGRKQAATIVGQYTLWPIEVGTRELQLI